MYIFIVYLSKILLHEFQEGDTALNLIIKMTKLRETGDMFRCAQLLVNHGALSTLKDLVGHALEVHIYSQLSISRSCGDYFLQVQITRSAN